MKLGLCVKVTNNGCQEFFSTDRTASWKAAADDARTYCREAAGFYGSGKTIVFLKFLGADGHLVCVVKATASAAGRLGDNTAAWIHVPARMDIDGHRLCEVIDDVRREMDDTTASHYERITALNEEFPERPGVRPAIAAIVSNAAAPAAWMQYGPAADYQLHELLGNRAAANPAYAKYKCVMLIGTDQAVSLPSNLLRPAIPQLVTVTAPVPTDGFRPFLGGAEWKQSDTLELPTGTRLTVEWRKNGYKPIKKNVDVRDNTDTQRRLQLTADEKLIEVRREWFTVSSESGRPLPNAEITIDGRSFSAAGVLHVRESSFQGNVSLGIRCPGYKEITSNYKLTSGKRDFRLKEDFYELLLRKEDSNLDKTITVTMPATALKGRKSPLKGYKIEGGELIYDGGFLKIKYALIGAATVVVIALLCIFVPMVGDLFSPDAETENTETIGNGNADNIDNDGKLSDRIDDGKATNPDGDINNAIALLNKDVWNKDELEGNVHTQGLFDKLNTFNFYEITGYKNTELYTGCPKFKKVVDEAAKCQRNNVVPEKATYNTDPADKQINATNYANALSNMCKPAASPEPRTSNTADPAPQKAISAPTKKPDKGKDKAKTDNAKTDKASSKKSAETSSTGSARGGKIKKD